MSTARDRSRHQSAW